MEAELMKDTVLLASIITQASSTRPLWLWWSSDGNLKLFFQRIACPGIYASIIRTNEKRYKEWRAILGSFWHFQIWIWNWICDRFPGSHSKSMKIIWSYSYLHFCSIRVVYCTCTLQMRRFPNYKSSFTKYSGESERLMKRFSHLPSDYLSSADVQADIYPARMLLLLNSSR